MPYKAKDVRRFTKKARSAKRKRQWLHTYESQRARGLSEGRAIRSASGAVKKATMRSKRQR